MLLLICATLFVLAYFAYKWITKDSQYFEEKGLPFIRPKYLVFFQRNSLPDLVIRWYNEFKNEK